MTRDQQLWHEVYVGLTEKQRNVIDLAFYELGSAIQDEFEPSPASSDKEEALVAEITRFTFRGILPN